MTRIEKRTEEAMVALQDLPQPPQELTEEQALRVSGGTQTGIE